MAKQKGIIPLNGTIGETTFIKGKHGNVARKKSNLTGERFKTEDNFINSRKSGSEFGNAGKHGGALIRAVLAQGVSTLSKHTYTHSRLNGLFGRIVRSDTVSVRGERYARAEHLHHLKGFEFHPDYCVSRIFFGDMRTSVNEEGKIIVLIRGFDPKEDLKWAKGATHVELRVVQVEGDFQQTDLRGHHARTGMLPKKSVPADIILELETATEDTILGLGISFFQEVNGWHEPLTGGACFRFIAY